MPDAVSITSSYSRIVARELKLQERDLPGLLAGTGLSRQVLMPGDETRLSWAQQIRVLENARNISVQDEFGLQVGRRLQPSVHGPIGYLALSSPDLITALKALRAYLPLRVGFTQLELEIRDDWIQCVLRITQGAGDGEMRLLHECFALLLQAVVESVLGRELHEGQFGFGFPTPSYADRYGEYLHSPISFGECNNYLRIPAALALATNAHGDADAYALARDMCQRLLDQVPASALSMGDRVRRLLLSQPAGSVTEEAVARALFVSRSTLARRLAGEGTGYRKIRENLYAELAARYLREGELAVEAIAALLGYHDTANFRRAFRRWYGVSPGVFRRSAAGSGEGSLSVSTTASI